MLYRIGAQLRQLVLQPVTLVLLVALRLLVLELLFVASQSHSAEGWLQVGQERSLFVWLHLFDHALLGVLLPVDLALLSFFSVGFRPRLTERRQVVNLFTLESLLV